MRRFLSIFVVSTVFASAAYAVTRSRTFSFDDTIVSVDHGSFQRLPDAGYSLQVCTFATDADGGAVPVNSPCVTCEGPLSGATLNACKAAWIQANGY